MMSLFMVSSNAKEEGRRIIKNLNATYIDYPVSVMDSTLKET